MSDRLEAAEALLATVATGRERIAQLSHAHLPFSSSLTLRLADTVGRSSTRLDATMLHETVDRRIAEWRRARSWEMIRLAQTFADAPVGQASASSEDVGAETAETVAEGLQPADLPDPQPASIDTTVLAQPPVVAEAEAEAEAPAPEPEAPAPEASTSETVAVAPFEPEGEPPEVLAAVEADYIDEATVVRELPPEIAQLQSAPTGRSNNDDPTNFDLPLIEDEPDRDSEEVPLPLPEEDEATDPGVRMDDLSAPELPSLGISLREPSEEDFSDDPSETDEEERPAEDAGKPDADEELTAATHMPPLAPEVHIGQLDVDETKSAASVTDTATAAFAPTPDSITAMDMPALGIPRVVEPAVTGGLGQPRPVAAAIQLTGDGTTATVLTDTLALGEADDLDADSVPTDDDSSGLSLSFEEAPEQTEEEEESEHVPELTESEDEAEASSVLHETPSQLVGSAEVDDAALANFEAQAREAEGRGDLQKAVLYYSDVLSTDPEDLESYLARGRCLMELGDYAAAMSDFQHAEDLAPDSPDPLVEMGNLFFARKEYRRSIHYYDQAIELDPTHAMARCRRGICHHYRKDHDQALADLQRAYSLDPDIPNIGKYVQMAVKAMRRAGR